MSVGIRDLQQYCADKAKAVASLKWPRTTGMVQNKQPGSSHLDVTFQYFVGGGTYLSDTITIPKPHFASGSAGMDDEEEWLTSNFNMTDLNGQNVEVFYNPSFPAQACLIPGENQFLRGELNSVVLAFSSCIFIIILICAGFFFREP